MWAIYLLTEHVTYRKYENIEIQYRNIDKIISVIQSNRIFLYLYRSRALSVSLGRGLSHQLRPGPS
jgi:hypothetical protein